MVRILEDLDLAKFAYVTLTVVLLFILGYLIAVVVVIVQADSPPDWIWGMPCVVSSATSLFYGRVWYKWLEFQNKRRLLAATVLNFICFLASVALTTSSGLGKLADNSFATQCTPPLVTIVIQICLSWGGRTWKSFKMLGSSQLFCTKHASLVKWVLSFGAQSIDGQELRSRASGEIPPPEGAQPEARTHEMV